MLAKRNFDSTLLFPICLRPYLNIPYPSGPPWWTRGVRCIGPEGSDLNNYKHFEPSERRKTRVRHNRNMFLQSLARLHIREICAICERKKLITWAHGWHGLHRLFCCRLQLVTPPVPRKAPYP